MECFEGADSFNYLGRVLHRSYKDWTEVFRNIWRSIQVWGWLCKLRRKEVAEPIVLEKFYRVVVQAVILFGFETWVFLSAMLQKLEGVHVSFLRKMMGMKD